MRTNQVKSWGLLLFFATQLGFTAVGLAASVENCDEASLRAALAKGGMVTFACDGTIVLTNQIVIEADRTIDASGHNVTLSGRNSVRIFEVLSNINLSLYNLTLADGRAEGTNGSVGQGGAARVQGGTLYAVDCTFATNNAVGSKGGTWGEGGAIYAAFAVLRLTNCAFIRNAATGGAGGDAPPGDPFAFGGDGGPSRGGSISAIASQITLKGGLFSNNAANPGSPGAGRWTGIPVDTWGGALYAENSICAGVGLTWRGNRARAAGGACFLAAGEAAFASCVFDGNGAADTAQTRGGAIRSLDGRLGLVDCLLRNNTVAGMRAFLIRGFGQNGGFAEGGAVSMAGGELGVTNCTFTGNLAQGGNGAFVGAPFFVLPAGSAQGGGLSHFGTGTVVNCTFAGNSAQHGWKASYQGPSGGLGGAMASGGNLTVQFSTIASNVVGDNQTNFEPLNSMNSRGAGCYVGTGSCVFASSILSGNFAQTGGSNRVPANASGPVIDGGHNLSSDATPIYTVSSSQNSVDPLLGPLVDNGGPTPTMALLPASPAVNAGDNALCPSTDQRGAGRPQLGACDIGAYELPGGFYIRALRSAGPDSFHLSGLGIPNQGFRVEFSTDLSNWMDATSGFVGPQGLFDVEVDRGLQPQRFYRTAAP